MVFKASRKPASKARASTPDPAPAPEESVTPAAFSVDDLVGGPVGEAPQTPAAQAAKPDMPQTPTPVRAPVQSQSGQGGYGGGYDRQSGGGYRGRPHAGGYNRRPNTGYRRDFAPAQQPGYSNGGQRWSGGESFTQDINVPTETVRGILDIMPEGHGFLRPKFTPSEKDIYISQSQIRRFLLRNGDMVQGQARQPKDNERYWGLLKVETVNELPADQMERRPKFEDLVPVYPNKVLRLETGQTPLSTRIIDLVCPIGFGQRGLVVSPPKAGKTTILKELAAGITANYPEVHLMAALIGERPEEVTDISRSVKGEVFASNFDESPAEQTRIAEVALDRAKRLVEMGKDVVVLLDSITRLARAYNLVVNPSGRTLSGGFDPAALYPAKRFLGAARCVEPFVFAQGKPSATPGVAQGKPFVSPEENPSLADARDKQDQAVGPASDSGVVTTSAVDPSTGGSLTVIGTALVDTGSRMDDLIYEEFKGTGNMELHLSRQLQERRVFPAIDIARSGTRHDELLLGEDVMKKVVTLRHMLSLLSDEERTMTLIDRLSKNKSNQEFLDALAKG